MRFWFVLLGAFVLALSAWGGGAASGAVLHDRQPAPQMMQCLEANAEEESECSLNGTHHHHTSCNGHNEVAHTPEIASPRELAAAECIGMVPPALITGRSPPSELRPPIA